MPTQEELLNRIRDLEREVKQLNSQIKRQKYGLTWLDVPEAFDTESENKIPILEEVPELAIHHDDGKPTHILIEGDNYHALTCLNYTHKGKIDVIYIDPPYNTGSDGFTYMDKRFLEAYPDGKIIPKNDPARHSTWISFIEKRLRFSLPLLKDDGVIFISINEDELSNLRLLCDELFGADNYITTFTIKVRHPERILKGDKPIHEVTEFLLMYQRSSAFHINKRVVDNSDPKEYKYEIRELIDNPQEIEMGGKLVQVFPPTTYVIDKYEPSFDHLKKINIRGTIKTGNSSGRFHMNYLEQRNTLYGTLYKVPNIGEDGRGYRYFLTRANDKGANGFYFQGAPLDREDVKEIPFPNFLDFEQEFNEVGTEGGVPFDGGKKPIDFITYLLNVAKGNKKLIVLVFFAGSGSTGHAVIKNGFENSHCVLVQYPELTYETKKDEKVAKPNCKNAFNSGLENICQITYKRMQNVMNGYTDSKGNDIAGLGHSLIYYRTAFVGKHQPQDAMDEDRIALSQKAGCLLALAENTLDETECNDFYQFYSDRRGRHTAIYFQEDLSHYGGFLKKVEKLKGHVVVYVFSFGTAEEFRADYVMMGNVELKAIPQPILDIYKSLKQ